MQGTRVHTGKGAQALQVCREKKMYAYKDKDILHIHCIVYHVYICALY